MSRLCVSRTSTAWGVKNHRAARSIGPCPIRLRPFLRPEPCCSACIGTDASNDRENPTLRTRQRRHGLCHRNHLFAGPPSRLALFGKIIVRPFEYEALEIVGAEESQAIYGLDRLAHGRREQSSVDARPLNWFIKFLEFFAHNRLWTEFNLQCSRMVPSKRQASLSITRRFRGIEPCRYGGYRIGIWLWQSIRASASFPENGSELARLNSALGFGGFMIW